MDLSFINMPTTQDELLGLLRVAYKAGQNSIDVPMRNQIVEHVNTGSKALIKPTRMYTFKGWLSRLAHQWEDIKHS